MTHHVELDAIELANGSHESRDDGMCVMEAVAWFAGEEHSDAPACASPVITRFAISLNDRWDDEQRQKLVAFVPKIVGTRDDRDDDRALLAADWLIRTFTPEWLRLAGLDEHADNLAGLPGLTDWSMLADWMATIAPARDSARAAWDAARAAAAWDAAAWDAAWDAAWNAAAWDAARGAARAAARDAARDALQPTVELLQESALDLLDRMCMVGR